MNEEDRKEYFILLNQYKNAYHLSKEDKYNLVHLNHLIMEDCHMIHNANMSGALKT